MGPLLGADDATRITTDYRRFWSIASGLSRQPPESWRRTLATVAVEPLLSEMVDAATEQHRKGLLDFGTIRLHPRIVRSSTRRVSIVDCQDASGSGLLDAETGAVTSVGSARTPFAGVMDLSSDGRWRLSQARLLDGGC